MNRGGQSVWPLYNVGTSIPSQSTHHGGGDQTVDPLPTTGSDCPYTLVQLNGDTCHVPLPREGHLNILAKRGTNITASGRVSQLQVHQLLSSGSQVVYPIVGLNGCEVPVIASPPESLAKGINLLRDKPIYLKVDILQSITEGPELKAPPLSSHSPSILITSPIRPPLPKLEGEVSMTTEVRNSYPGQFWTHLSMHQEAPPQGDKSLWS